MIKNKDKVYFCNCVQKTVAVKIHDGESVEELKSGNISAAVFEKDDRKKCLEKWEDTDLIVMQLKHYVVLMLRLDLISLLLMNLQNCDTNNKNIICMKCYFYYHLSCLGRRSNFKNLTSDACILYKERNKLL